MNSHSYAFRSLAALLLTYSTTACVQKRPEPIPPVPVDPAHCGDFSGVHDFLEVDPSPARQGATLRIAAKQWRGPGLHDVPPDCTSDWTVSDPKLATLADDRKSVRIADDATPGSTVIVSYRIKGQSVGAKFLIVGKSDMVLTGRRSQSAIEGCERLTPIGELEFSAEGRFSVTWRPFETYRDYWGAYRLDPATGALSMTVDGGNDRPAGLDLEGKASIGADGKLVLEDMYLGVPSHSGGPPPGVRACRYTFG